MTTTVPPTARPAEPDTAPGAARRALLQRNLDCDVCVLGDDVAGLLIARDLARKGRDVVLFATGPAVALPLDGTLAPGFALSTGDLVARVGEADAQELLFASAAAAQRGTELAAALAVPLGPKGRLLVARPHAAADLAREQELRDRLVPDSSLLLDAADTRALLDTEAFAAALGVVPAQRVDPRGFRAALLAAAQAEGVRLMPAEAGLGADVHGLRKYVLTPKLKVRAYEVVFCGDFAVARIAGALAASLVATPWVHGALALAGAEVAYAGLVEEAGAAGLRYHVDGTRLVLAAGTATRIRGRSAAGRVLQRHSREIYPQTAAVPVEGAAGTVLARTMRQMPLIQEGEKGVWYAATLGDGEVTHGLLAADLVCAAITERDDRIRLLQPFGLEPASARPASRLWPMAAYWHARLSTHLPATAEAARHEEAEALPPPRLSHGPHGRHVSHAAARLSRLSRQAARAALGIALARRPPAGGGS